MKIINSRKKGFMTNNPVSHSDPWRDNIIKTLGNKNVIFIFLVENRNYVNFLIQKLLKII